MLTIAWVLLSVNTNLAAEPQPLVEVGVARVDITPEPPIRLMGYGNRREEATEVAQRLQAKALAIGGDAQGPALLMTLDLIGPSKAVVDELAARLQKKAGIERARLAVCGTHTHTGPCLAESIPNIFGQPLPPEHQRHIDDYTAALIDKLETVALAALADRQPSRLDWGQGRVTFAVNRRVLDGGQWKRFGEALAGPVDHSLPLLRVTTADGALRAVLVNYACHCTTLTGEFNAIHGDWAGEAAAIIEREHPGAVALISIGCGADANPRPRGDLAAVAANARQLADEVKRLLTTKLKSVPAVSSCQMEHVDLPFGELPQRGELESIARGGQRDALWARSQLARLERGEALPKSLRYPLQVWTFGDELAMVFLPGEVVVDYSLRLKSLLDAERLWVNAYANELPCYIASRRLIAEGGYEVDGSMKYYDQPARFDPAVEEVIVGSVTRLVPSEFKK